MTIFIQQNVIWVVATILIWSTPWKAVALWKAARRAHAGWFIALLLLNTIGLLDIIYIYFFSRKMRVQRKNQQAQSENQ